MLLKVVVVLMHGPLHHDHTVVHFHVIMLVTAEDKQYSLSHTNTLVASGRLGAPESAETGSSGRVGGWPAVD